MRVLVFVSLIGCALGWSSFGQRDNIFTKAVSKVKDVVSDAKEKFDDKRDEWKDKLQINSWKSKINGWREDWKESDWKQKIDDWKKRDAEWKQRLGVNSWKSKITGWREDWKESDWKQKIDEWKKRTAEWKKKLDVDSWKEKIADWREDWKEIDWKEKIQAWKDKHSKPLCPVPKCMPPKPNCKYVPNKEKNARGCPLYPCGKIECKMLDCTVDGTVVKNGANYKSKKSPCLQGTCRNGYFAKLVIDCAEHMGATCDGEWVKEPGQCCSTCVTKPKYQCQDKISQKRCDNKKAKGWCTKKATTWAVRKCPNTCDVCEAACVDKSAKFCKKKAFRCNKVGTQRKCPITCGQCTVAKPSR